MRAQIAVGLLAGGGGALLCLCLCAALAVAEEKKTGRQSNSMPARMVRQASNGLRRSGGAPPNRESAPAGGGVAMPTVIQGVATPSASFNPNAPVVAGVVVQGTEVSRA